MMKKKCAMCKAGKKCAKCMKKGTKKWIQSAIEKPGSLHKELHVPMGKKIPKAALEKASHAKGKEGKRARLALTLSKLRKKK